MHSRKGLLTTALRTNASIERSQMSNTDSLSLAHTSRNCKHHVVFAPKHRRKELYGLKRLEIGQILRKLCERKGIAIHEAEVCPDHVHMLISAPPKFSVSGIMGYLKGKSSLMIYQKWGERETQVPEPRILVPGVLRRHGWEKREEDRGTHPKSAQGRSGCSAAFDRLRRGPFQRVASNRCGRRSVPRPP